jgi:hypothetical protein
MEIAGGNIRNIALNAAFLAAGESTNIEVDENMSDRAHMVEIDSMVLAGVDPQCPGRLSDLIHAEVRRAIAGTRVRLSEGMARNETSIAGEVARTVVRSIQGGSNSV